MTGRVLIVEDDAALREAIADSLELSGYQVSTVAGGDEALAQLARMRVDLVLSDVHMRGMDGIALLRRLRADWPELPVLLMTAYGTIPKAVEAMRLGAVDYLQKPFEAPALGAAVARWLVTPAATEEPVAEDPRSRELMALARRVAVADVTLFLTGESGTGKEVIARFVHRHSHRAKGPFVAINCAAIPEAMLEATLFGYEKGAFTGAVKGAPGKFEQANGGTLLLDEISEMALSLQAKLLRVLQEREVERLGGQTTIPLDVRVIATSNRNLKAEVAAGRFREDLYYRLNVFPLRIPALRERPADILPLAERLIARAAAGAGLPAPLISREARERLTAYPYPGNVRELDNLMQRALILAESDEVTARSLHFEGEVPPEPAGIPAPPAAEGLTGDLRNREFELILSALNGGNRKDAARRLGISDRTLRYKLQRMREEGFAVPA